MNVIVANKNETALSSLDIDVLNRIVGVFSVQDLAKQFKNFYYNRLILDVTALENYEDINTMKDLALLFDMNKVILLLDDSRKVNSPKFLSELVSIGIYNFTDKVSLVKYLIDNPNSYKDVAHYQNLQMNNMDYEQSVKLNDNISSSNESYVRQRIIGIKNLTPHAGATTLTYLLKIHLEKLYNVKAVQIDSSDFDYFKDDNLDKVTSFEFKDYLNNNDKAEAIVVDLNGNENDAYCSDIIYLIETGIIQLNRLNEENDHIFESLKGKKLVINRSTLSQNDIRDFEKESGTKVYYNLPNVDDKEDDIKEINEFLGALGFTRISQKKEKSFGLFK